MSLTSFELYFRFMYCIRHLVSSLIFHAVSGNSSRSPWGPLRRFALCCVFFHYQASLISLLCRRESLVLHFLLWWWFSHQVVSDSLRLSWTTAIRLLCCSVSLGISQARILEQVAISCSRVSFQPRDWTWVSCITGRLFFLTTWANREAYDLPQVVAMGETTCHKANL